METQKIYTDNNISDIVEILSKNYIFISARQLNGDDVKVSDCIFNGKKKFYQVITFNRL